MVRPYCHPQSLRTFILLHLHSVGDRGGGVVGGVLAVTTLAALARHICRVVDVHLALLRDVRVGPQRARRGQLEAEQRGRLGGRGGPAGGRGFDFNCWPVGVVRELLVVLEVGELREALEAEVAREGLLARVDERVPLQLGRRGESLAAVDALVPLRLLLLGRRQPRRRRRRRVQVVAHHPLVYLPV